MPASAGDPQPPDAAQRYFQRQLRRNLGRADAGRLGGNPSRGIDPATGRPSLGRQDISTDPQWSKFQDRRGLGESPADVLGAMDLVGDQWQKRAGGYHPDELFSDLLGADPDYEVVSWDEPQPWGSTPVRYTTTVGDFYANEASAYLEDEGFYDEMGYGYPVNPGGDPDNGRAPTVAEISSVGTWPADITMAPTATKHPERPRTVAAGYDSKRRVLTVIFRDGTFYNYYGVSSLEWGNFGRHRSKGEHINEYLNGKVRGPADVAAVPLAHRELLYKVARTAQVRTKGLQRGHSAVSPRGKVGYRGVPGSSKSGGRSYRKTKTALAAAAATGMPPGTSRFTGGKT